VKERRVWLVRGVRAVVENPGRVVDEAPGTSLQMSSRSRMDGTHGLVRGFYRVTAVTQRFHSDVL
jgi:hypothetical protein